MPFIPNSNKINFNGIIHSFIHFHLIINYKNISDILIKIYVNRKQGRYRTIVNHGNSNEVYPNPPVLV
jgi:hypothetical protein